MEASVQLRVRIEETGRQVQSDYVRALEKVQKLKKEMNTLEQEPSETRLKTLDSTIKRLNRLTDSQIMRSKKAWEQYRKLERECTQYTLLTVQLDKLKAICTKTEELAADLLCYSLARFKQNEHQS